MIWRTDIGQAPFEQEVLCAVRTIEGGWTIWVAEKRYVNCDILQDGTLDKWLSDDYEVPRIGWWSGEWEQHPPTHWAPITTPDFPKPSWSPYIANVIKYVARCDHKGNAIEDLKKARWYLEREIAKRGGK